MKRQLGFISHTILIGFISMLSFTACSPAKKSPQGALSNLGMDGIYSIRTQIKEPVITIIRLQIPALLETSQRVNGKLVIDQDQLTSIQQEQAETLAALEKISPEIKVLIRYKFVLNALTIVAPEPTLDKIRSLPNVTLAERSSAFSRPILQRSETTPTAIGSETSVKFIGSEAAYAQGLHGEGMRVGVVDTGIDYTHKMFYGEGTEAAYKAVDPAAPNAAFPTKKVVAGIDLVGTAYNPASPDFSKHIPTPDLNPLDEAGHGTHVAGTIAGVGDGINTYDGVAPAAELYAIKVFGAKGSTSDEVVIAALEYAINPSGDLQFNDQLDVVNLSLGSGYGNPHIMYNHAIRNTVRGGTIVVASGGNSGDRNFIVGAPGVSDDAISVASSVDNMLINIQFPTAEFTGPSGKVNVEFVEGGTSKKLSTFPVVQAELIFLGLADKDFDQAMKDQIKGKIALIDRGVITFAEKVKRAQDSGAIAAVVVNNNDEDPSTMGGDGSLEIPSVMISKKAGTDIKAQMLIGVVSVDLKPNAKVEKPWLIDTVSSFSSRGPRSEDGMIKPEIAAPGSNTISADMGAGDKGVPLSGTSMAAPHISGVMALLKQKFRDLDPYELKSVLLSQAKVIADKDKKIYTISRQGAGRVQVAASLEARVLSNPATLSFGITDIEKQKTMVRELTIKNISDKSLTLTPDWTGSAGIQLSAKNVTLAPGEFQTVKVVAKITASLMKNANDELDGFLVFKSADKNELKVPALVLARQISQIVATPVIVQATSPADAAGSLAEVKIDNHGINKGSAHLFNLLGLDGRKKDPKPDLAHNRNCDMQSAGYRIIEKEGTRLLQVAVKLFESMTTWNTCELNIQIDSNNDNITDQELAGVPQDSLPGLTATTFASLLLDGNKARQLRQDFEVAHAKDSKIEENYSTAIVEMREMQVFDNSTLAIIEADISLLSTSDSGELSLKISTTHQDSGTLEYDDYLAQQASNWLKISTSSQAQAFAEIPETIELAGQQSTTISLVKGYSNGDLVLYAPQNRAVRDVLIEDAQSQVIPTHFAE